MPSTRSRWILLAAVVVHLVAAWYSSGFQNADEHYQIVSFAKARLGHQPPSALPWEYAAHIRSAFLPSICWAVFRAAHAIGIDDPFVQTFLLRLLTALLALCAVWSFVRSSRHLILSRFHQTFLLLSFFLWFLPFLHVRFTGETWSGLFMLLGLAKLISPEAERGRHLRTGLFFGLAFLCRPPTLAMAIGVLLWLIFIHKEELRNVIRLLIGILAVAILEVALDSWFYGGFSLTAWNYLRMGMIGSTAHPFTPFPWWYYFAWVVKYAIPLFGVPILLAFGALLRFRPKNVIVWAIVPFLVLHILLPHKELRFLYPLGDLAPIMLVLAIQDCTERWPRKSQGHQWKGAVLLLLIMFMVVDLLALSVVISSPAGSGRTRLAECIRERYSGSDVRINYLADEKTVWDIRIPACYLPPSCADTMIGTSCLHLADDPPRIQLLIAQGPLSTCENASGTKWCEVWSALPDWSIFALHAYDWEDARPTWTLYEEATASSHRSK